MNLEPKENIKQWAVFWKASKGDADKVKKTRQPENVWNQRATNLAKGLSPTNPRNQKRADEILGFLEEAGFRADGAKVLDIGCGPGALSIPLARAGAQVTSLDISSKILGHLKEIANSENLSIKPIVGSWWTADIDKLGFRKKFDLVIASNTPSVNDAETFEWMMACSRKYCYFSGVLQRGADDGPPGYQDICRTILEMDPPPRQTGPHYMSTPFIFPFMYLYLNDYRPLVRINHNQRKMDGGWSDEADRAINFIGQSHPLDEATKMKIREYYEKSARERKKRIPPKRCSGMMVWTVDH
jgi:SAM-dependent methyltransferase